jgi:AcrR family transcriptional regulator
MNSKLNSGRIKQKHRTRNALTEAAAQLLREGREPTLEEVADAAQVSRATAYRYFPTQELLLAGVAVLSANLDGDARLEAAMETPDAGVRLDRLVLELHGRFSSNEMAYRTLLRLMLQQPKHNSDNEEQPHARGSRHVHWLHEALAPIRLQLGSKRLERLIAALLASTGLEAYVALRDVTLLDPEQAGEVMRWTAQALLKAALAEADGVSNDH